MAIPDLFGSGGSDAGGSFPQNRAGEDDRNKYYDPYADIDTGRKRGTYSEVDEDAPYNPLEIDRSGYDQQTADYNAWLSRQRALLERDGGMGAQQMRAGLNQAQLAMQAQATGRGANPGNERAALYAGGQMQRSGAIDAAQLTAQEMAQMQQMQSGAMAQQAQDEIDWQAMEMQRQEMMANQYAAMVTGDIAETSNDWNRGSGMVGTVIGAAAGAASDVRVKQDMSQAAPAAQDATIRGLDAYQYDYRPEYQEWAARVGGMPAGAKQGRQTGVMAQDLERTPLGQTMVYDDPNTGMKAIDGGQAVTTTMGLVGRLGERADELEARLAELEAQRQAASSRKGQRRG